MSSWDVRQGDCLEVMRELDAASVDAVVCDPPYGLEFMGKDWDRFGRGEAASGATADFRPDGMGKGFHALPSMLGGLNPRCRKCGRSQRGGSPCTCAEPDFTDERGPRLRAYQAWCEAWAREALRVLKPGGHLLAFGGTRTYHRLACAIEDAGFEIRDCLAWMFGSGFPKSLDVSKAIDRLDAAAERDERAKRSQGWLRQYVTPQQVNAATGTEMGHHLTTHPTQPFVPTPAMLEQLRPLLPPIPGWLEQLVRDRAVESANMAAREVVGERVGTTMPGFARIADGQPTSWEVTRAHTSEAREWQGWGTALKPAHEPVVVARKPLVGTVAQNVLATGCGALNVDACRIGSGGDKGDWPITGRTDKRNSMAGPLVAAPTDQNAGRWPANVVLDEEAAGMLDEQTGELPRGYASSASPGLSGDVYGKGKGAGFPGGYSDSGGASRFFYCAKASRAERNAGLDGMPEQFPGQLARGGKPTHRMGRTPEEGWDGREQQPTRNVHPTVKPIALMRWLCRLVAPPEGLILDPFCGSGTTGCAAALEGFRFVGIEREAEYVEIARARIAFWAEHGEGALEAMYAAERAEATRATLAAGGQTSLDSLLADGEGEAA